RIALEDVVEEPGAGRDRQVLRAEADQPARRNAVLEAHAAAAVRDHVHELAASLREPAHDRALMLLVEIARDELPRLVNLAVDAALDRRGTRHRELVALAPHRLDQHRQMQLAAARDAEPIRVVGLLDAQRDVVLGFLLEPGTNLAAREVLAFASGERRLVDLEGHRDRRLVDLERRQAVRMAARADRVRDAEILDPAEHDDVAGRGRLDALALEAVEAVELAEGRVLDAAVAADERDRRARGRDAAGDPTDAEHADVRVVVEARNLKLQRAVERDLRRRNVLDDRLEQRGHVARPDVRIAAGEALQ